MSSQSAAPIGRHELGRLEDRRRPRNLVIGEALPAGEVQERDDPIVEALDRIEVSEGGSAMTGRPAPLAQRPGAACGEHQEGGPIASRSRLRRADLFPELQDPLDVGQRLRERQGIDCLVGGLDRVGETGWHVVTEECVVSDLS